MFPKNSERSLEIPRNSVFLGLGNNIVRLLFSTHSRSTCRVNRACNSRWQRSRSGQEAKDLSRSRKKKKKKRKKIDRPERRMAAKHVRRSTREKSMTGVEWPVFCTLLRLSFHLPSTCGALHASFKLVSRTGSRYIDARSTAPRLWHAIFDLVACEFRRKRQFKAFFWMDSWEDSLHGRDFRFSIFYFLSIIFIYWEQMKQL